MIGYLVGWLGVAFGLMVAPFQLYKIIKSQRVDGISLHTYIFLCCALVCYLLHAIYIKSIVFTVAQSLNLITNGTILIYLLRRRWGAIL